MTRPTLLVLLLALLLGAACKTAPVYDVMSAPLGSGGGASLEEVGKRIDRAARMQSWETEQVSPGVMIVTKRRGQHVGTATIRYDTQRFDISLRNSANLRQSADGGSIHKLYNQWVQSLERTIRREVSAPN